MNLIELKDLRLAISNDDGVLAQSTGFANVAGKEPVFGEAARRMARLHPRQSFNQFWHQLSLDPLLIKTKFFRHHADVAFGHLQQLTTGVSAEPTLVAAPTSYTRPQLGVLLGVLKQTGLPVQGLIDHALLQAAASGSADCIVLDLQLHQAVLAGFRLVDGLLVKERVVQVPGAGLLALQDAWSSAITDAFLQQSRFDPTHSAETEQYIADQLDTWLAASATQGELLLEINHKGSAYQAHVTHDQFAQRTKALFGRIARELPQLRTPHSTLHVQASHLSLPGFAAAFPGISAVADDATLATALRFQQTVLRPGEPLGFITRLPLDADVRTATSKATAVRLPTHVLYRHQAMALPQGRLAFGTPPADVTCARVLSLAGVDGAIVLNRTLRDVTVEAFGALSLRCNGKPVHGSQSLTLGDQLQIDGHDAALQLIAVE